MEQQPTAQGPGQPGQGPQLTEAEILALPTLECDCGGIVFEAVVVFKKMSMLISPTGKEERVPLNLMFCKKCGKIPSALYDPAAYAKFPEELQVPKK